KTATGNSDETLKDISWDVKSLKGQKAYIEIIDSETGSWGHINVDEIAFSNLPAKEKYFPDDHPYFGNAALSVLDAGGFATSEYKGTGQMISNAVQSGKPLGEKLLGAVGTSVA